VKPYADHFSKVAADYAARRPRYPPELFRYLATLAPSRHLAWDCAAGTGQATVPLAEWFERVVATDASSAMVAQADRHPKVEYRLAPAERSGLPDRGVDLVTVAQALHWLPLSDFYAEVERVLAPGGVLAVWTYGINQVDGEPADTIVSAFYRDVVGPFWPAERQYVESGYRTLSFPFDELVPPAFAMRVEWTMGELLGYIATWSATQRYREAMGHDPLERLATELGSHWGDSGTRRTITWPLTLRIGKIRRAPAAPEWYGEEQG
jgi:SAM-dependent methyltransferase